MTLTEFMELFGLTGRLLMPGKSGAMPKNASPILDRLNLFAELQPQGSTQWRSLLWSELMFRCAPTYDSQKAASSGTFGSLSGFIPGGEKWNAVGN
jgi:hypothetical protein